eukprot:scaffold121991_cov30-Tisochrysis_lutea.AAC.3
MVRTWLNGMGKRLAHDPSSPTVSGAACTAAVAPARASLKAGAAARRLRSTSPPPDLSFPSGGWANNGTNPMWREVRQSHPDCTQVVSPRLTPPVLRLLSLSLKTSEAPIVSRTVSCCGLARRRTLTRCGSSFRSGQRPTHSIA